MRFVVLVIVLLLVGVGFAIGKNIVNVTNIQSQLQTETQQEGGNTTSSEVVIDNPQRIRIPAINVDADIEHVGLDEQRNMDVPKNEANVAWYMLGYKPGQTGNSVMAGHLDTRTGAPAVFYNLKDLSPGDEIIVTGDNREELTYVVAGKATYPYDQFPLEEVFGATSKQRLNLITCEGVFNSAQRIYSHRVVVYSELETP